MITLYEFPSNLPDQTPISPYTALIRTALNYRRIPFQSEFISPRHLRAFARYLGAEPTEIYPDGEKKWTVPIIVDDAFLRRPSVAVSLHEQDARPSGKVDDVQAEAEKVAPTGLGGLEEGPSGEESPFLAISDSLAILRHIEREYPDPERPIFPLPSSAASTPTAATFSSSIVAVETPEFFDALCRLCEVFVDPLAPSFAPVEDEEFWVNSLATRRAAGRSDDDDAESCTDTAGQDTATQTIPKLGSSEFESAVQEARKALQPTISLLLHSSPSQDGPWLTGPTPTYPDFILIAWLRTIEICAPVLYKRLVEGDGKALGVILERGRMWARFERTKEEWEMS